MAAKLSEFLVETPSSFLPSTVPVSGFRDALVYAYMTNTLDEYLDSRVPEEHREAVRAARSCRGLAKDLKTKIHDFVVEDLIQTLTPKDMEEERPAKRVCIRRSPRTPKLPAGFTSYRF